MLNTITEGGHRLMNALRQNTLPIMMVVAVLIIAGFDASRVSAQQISTAHLAHPAPL